MIDSVIRFEYPFTTGQSLSTRESSGNVKLPDVDELLVDCCDDEIDEFDENADEDVDEEYDTAEVADVGRD